MLAGLSMQRTLRKLHIAKNEFGSLSASELVKILVWAPPLNLTDLLLEDLQTNDFAIANTFKILKQAKKLRKLQMSQITLCNGLIFKDLVNFIKSNKELTVLKLSWGGLQAAQLDKIGKYLA